MIKKSVVVFSVFILLIFSCSKRPCPRNNLIYEDFPADTIKKLNFSSCLVYVNAIDEDSIKYEYFFQPDDGMLLQFNAYTYFKPDSLVTKVLYFYRNFDGMELRDETWLKNNFQVKSSIPRNRKDTSLKTYSESFYSYDTALIIKNYPKSRIEKYYTDDTLNFFVIFNKNECGIETERIAYSSDTILMNFSEYFLTEEGYVKKILNYDADSTLTGQRVYEYYKKYPLEVSEEFFTDGKLISETKRQLDNKGREIKSIDWSMSDSLKTTILTYWNKQGLITKQSICFEKNDFSLTDTLYYRYFSK